MRDFYRWKIIIDIFNSLNNQRPFKDAYSIEDHIADSCKYLFGSLYSYQAWVYTWSDVEESPDKCVRMKMNKGGLINFFSLGYGTPLSGYEDVDAAKCLSLAEKPVVYRCPQKESGHEFH